MRVSLIAVDLDRDGESSGVIPDDELVNPQEKTALGRHLDTAPGADIEEFGGLFCLLLAGFRILDYGDTDDHFPNQGA